MISKVIHKKCLKKGLTIAFAESITGGALTHEYVKNAGASKVLKGSIVAYSVELKTKLLNIDPLLIYEEGVVSKQVAIEMAKSIKAITSSDIGIGITGDAGPTFSKGSHKQEAFLAIINHEKVVCHAIDLSHLTRIEAIKKAVFETYQTLENLI